MKFAGMVDEMTDDDEEISTGEWPVDEGIHDSSASEADVKVAAPPKVRVMDLPPSQRPDKILNNNFNKVDFGSESSSRGEICIDPDVESQYEESTTSDMSGILESRELENDIYRIFVDSSWYIKYGGDIKKTDKNDIPGIYFYFKDALDRENMYNSVQIFCSIAEFFDINYAMLYNDVLTIDDKSEILTILEDSFNLKKKYLLSKKLF